MDHWGGSLLWKWAILLCIWWVGATMGMWAAPRQCRRHHQNLVDNWYRLFLSLWFIWGSNFWVDCTSLDLPFDSTVHVQLALLLVHVKSHPNVMIFLLKCGHLKVVIHEFETCSHFHSKILSDQYKNCYVSLWCRSLDSSLITLRIPNKFIRMVICPKSPGICWAPNTPNKMVMQIPEWVWCHCWRFLDRGTYYIYNVKFAFLYTPICTNVSCNVHFPM